MRALLSRLRQEPGSSTSPAALHELGVELVVVGGTARAIDEAGIPVTHLADVTGFPEMLDHRVVTLHPKVHGGILADREQAEHLADIEQYGIEPFDIVVTNLYPFRESTRRSRPIDIGGPAMMRAAAKNHAWVAIVTDPAEYDDVLAELRERAARSATTRGARAGARGVRRAPPPTTPRSSRGSRRRRAAARAPRARARPHRRAAALRREPAPAGARATARSARTSWWDGVTQHSGVALIVPQPLRRRRRVAARARSRRPAARAPSSSTPTRAASPSPTTSPTAYQRALECDERSAFGGIVALNRPIDDATVERMVAGPQADVVIAPGYERRHDRARCAKRKNTRLLEAPAPRADARRPPPDHRRVPRAGRRTTSSPAATTGAWSPSARPTERAVARRRARVAHRAAT